MDQRKYPRKQVRLSGSLRGEAPFADGTLEDLSRGGCAFQCESTLQIGNFLELEIRLPGEEPPLKIEVAVVRWAKSQRFGLEFLRIHAREKERIRELVKTPQWMHNLKRVTVGLRPRLTP